MLLGALLIVLPSFTIGRGRLIMLYRYNIFGVAMLAWNLYPSKLAFLSILWYYLGKKIMAAVTTPYFNFFTHLPFCCSLYCSYNFFRYDCLAASLVIFSVLQVFSCGM